MSITHMALGYKWKFSTSTEREVYMALADHADVQGNNIRPSAHLIAWKLDIDVRTVRRNVKKLLASGILICQENNGKRGKPNMYRIDVTKGIEKAAYQPEINGQNVTPQDDKMSPLPVTLLSQPGGDIAVSPKSPIQPSNKPSDKTLAANATPEFKEHSMYPVNEALKLICTKEWFTDQPYPDGWIHWTGTFLNGEKYIDFKRVTEIPALQAESKSPPSSETPPIVPKPVQPHVAIIAAWHAGHPDGIRPVQEPSIPQYVAPAMALVNAGFTAEQVIQFMADTYPGYSTWAAAVKGRPPVMSFKHVTENIKAWQNGVNNGSSRTNAEQGTTSSRNNGRSAGLLENRQPQPSRVPAGVHVKLKGM